MKIKKAVITAAGRNQNRLPIQTLVDRDGLQKTALQIILEEAFSTGVEEICIVVCPGDQQTFAAAAGHWEQRLRFVEQPSPLGYGHALYCAREFTQGDPFLHLVSDHLYLSRETRRCAQQLVEIASAESCSVSAVQPTRESLLPYYGVVGGKGLPSRSRVYIVEKVMEKPTPTEAEQELVVPGLRAGHYLCFFGLHVLTPAIIEILGENVAKTKGAHAIQLSPALVILAEREKYLAFEIMGRRYNIGLKFGFLTAQLAFALDGNDREEILAQLVELLAQRQS